MISGSLTKLNVPAAVTRKDTFYSWDRASDLFVSGFSARLYPADRFKTIYHRPTRRETISIGQGTSLPSTLLIRHEVTLTIFATASVDRSDSSHDTVYDEARAVHRVAAGEVFREEVQGTGDDLGPLIRSSQGILYGDLELRTEEKVPDSHRETSGSFFLTCPNDPDLQMEEGDYFSFTDGDYAGLEYRIREKYTEAGFQLARAESRAKDMENLTYELITGAGSYDPTTGVVLDPTTSDRIFSGTVTDTDTEEETEGGKAAMAGTDLTLYVYLEHIGFDFKIDGTIRRGSDSFKIYSLKIGADDLQWIVKMQRAP